MTRLTTKLATTSALAIFAASAFSTANAQATDPNQFVQQVADTILQQIKSTPAAQKGDVNAIRPIINQYLMPNVDFNKTTRLAVGAPWRQATDAQKQALVSGFKETLIRTYSGAFKSVNSNTQIKLEPFRGDPNANDVVVRSSVNSASGPVRIDYRLQKAGNSWKVYDFSVENVWLVQNYRNQFASEISRNGIDGLIQKLKTPK